MTGRNNDFEDDGRVIADMSDVTRTPVLMPHFEHLRKDKDALEDDASHGDIYLERDEKRAMIRGAVSAGLVVVGCIALAFAVFILLIGKVIG